MSGRANRLRNIAVAGSVALLLICRPAAGAEANARSFTIKATEKEETLKEYSDYTQQSLRYDQQQQAYLDQVQKYIDYWTKTNPMHENTRQWVEVYNDAAIAFQQERGTQAEAVLRFGRHLADASEFLTENQKYAGEIGWSKLQRRKVNGELVLKSYKDWDGRNPPPGSVPSIESDVPSFDGREVVSVQLLSALGSTTVGTWRTVDVQFTNNDDSYSVFGTGYLWSEGDVSVTPGAQEIGWLGPGGYRVLRWQVRPNSEGEFLLNTDFRISAAQRR